MESKKVKVSEVKINPNNPSNEEVFIDIKGYETLYQISNYGQVKSLKRTKWNGFGYQTIPEKIIKNRDNRKGYFQVFLSKEGKVKAYKVHQLVAICFLNHTPDKKMNIVVNHKNFNKLDNRPENLELVTQRENANKKHFKSTSQYTGVSWEKYKNKWRSRIYIDGKNRSIGMYDNEIDAHEAYQKKLNSLRE